MASSSNTTPSRRRRKPDALTRERILHAAAELLEEKGMEAVTMSGVASRLGVAAMSLYAHVGSKADLLQGMYEAMIGEVRPDEQDDLPWDEWIVRAFCMGRREALKQPALAYEVASIYVSNAAHGPLGLIKGSAFLDVFTKAGISEADATLAYVTINSFAVGFRLWEIPRFHLQGVEEYRRDYLRRIAQAEDPPGSQIWTMLNVLTERPIEEIFEQGLRMVVAGIKATLQP